VPAFQLIRLVQSFFWLSTLQDLVEHLIRFFDLFRRRLVFSYDPDVLFFQDKAALLSLANGSFTSRDH